MAKSATNPKVDRYISKNEHREMEINKLREIALESGLAEALKWGCPCYTLKGTNVFLIHVFKEFEMPEEFAIS